MDFDQGQLLCRDAGCPGDWIMQTALTRTEAGALFELAGRPDCVNVSEIPWEISVVNAHSEHRYLPENESVHEEKISSDMIAKLSSGIAFSYGNIAATQIPSKLTATQLKGRTLDTEIAEGCADKSPMAFRKPGTADITGQTYGKAIHGAMQYIRFDACTDIDSIRRDVDRMEQEHLLAPEQAKLVDCEKLLAFFTSSIGKKLCASKEILREFKFSLLVDADCYYPDAAGEQVLLQGVVDCAIVEEDGIIVLDFKTDYVTSETITSAVEKYTPQVKAYSQALERIYEKPVKQVMLYFFHRNEFVNVI